ncbi:acyl-CoA thioesterase [Actinomadura sp. 9N407]|uniref:acyl-CoA thioesterase n=1 Tax=Actinomadura sp. 9N407 TaxID=3375154 RepID=UPI0037BCE3BC
MTAETRPAAVTEYGYHDSHFVHFDDLDSLGMVHNARYQILVERTLTDFWESRGYTFANGAATHPDTFVAVASYSIGFMAPVLGTGTVRVHLWVEKFGKSSVTYGFRVLSGDHATVHAEGTRVHIRLDRDTMRSAPWAEDTRAIYASMQPG